MNKRAEVLSTGETVTEFNRRLYAAGLTEEFRIECRVLAGSEEISYAAARRRLAEEYPPERRNVATKAGEAREEEWEGKLGLVEFDGGEEGSISETLQWVADAMGWLKAGKGMEELEFPGPRALSCLDWARSQPDKFWALLTGESRKQTGADAEGEGEVHLQAGEIEEMLAEAEGAVDTEVKG